MQPGVPQRESKNGFHIARATCIQLPASAIVFFS